MAKRPGDKFRILEPCSGTSTLQLSAGLKLKEVGGSTKKGQVWTITGPGSGGLNAEVDYVHHLVTISPSPGSIVVRVGDGIDVQPIPNGLTFSVPDGFNVIPVYDPDTRELGYFKAEIPPKPGGKE